MNGLKKIAAVAAAFTTVAAVTAPVVAEAHYPHYNNNRSYHVPPPPVYRYPAPRQYQAPQNNYRRHNDTGAIIGGIIAGGVLGTILGNAIQQNNRPNYYVAPNPGYQPPPPSCTVRGQHDCINPYTNTFVP